MWTLTQYLDGRDDAALLRYYAGISNAEIGDIPTAIDHLVAFLAKADPQDQLYRDAAYKLGMMLPTVGRAADGLRYLSELRPVLVSAYGPESAHVAGLDRRIAQVRRRITEGT